MTPSITARPATTLNEIRRALEIRYEVFRDPAGYSGKKRGEPLDEYDYSAHHLIVELDGQDVASTRTMSGASPLGLPSYKLFAELGITGAPPEADCDEPSKFGVLTQYRRTREGTLITHALAGAQVADSLQRGCEWWALTFLGSLFNALPWFPFQEITGPFGSSRPGWPPIENPYGIFAGYIFLPDLVQASYALEPTLQEALFPGGPPEIDLLHVCSPADLEVQRLRNVALVRAGLQEWRNEPASRQILS